MTSLVILSFVISLPLVIVSVHAQDPQLQQLVETCTGPSGDCAQFLQSVVQIGETKAGLTADASSKRAVTNGREPQCPTFTFRDGLPGRLGNKLGHIFWVLNLAPSLGLCSLRFTANCAQDFADILSFDDQDIALDNVSSMQSSGEVLNYYLPRKTGADIDWYSDEWWWTRTFDDPADLARTHQKMLKYVAPYRKPCSPQNGETSPDHIVMHMRSGDIWDYPYNGSSYHQQPPCNWYVEVMDKGNGGSQFESATIVTDPTQNNPCIAVMKDHFPGQISLQSGTVADDACTIMSAHKLAWSMSTFAVMLTTLNLDVTDVFIPFGYDNGTTYPNNFDTWWKEFAWSETPMRYKQHLYSFPGYDPSHPLIIPPEHPLKTYPRESMILRTIEADH